MRPHRLTLTAFGSFPGTEHVDFDALTEAGLFLVHGPTGAGKTTVLDGLAFALYGRVPGQRDSARSLRCDHAPPETGPAVRLEVTIRGRRLLIERSPAWQRPKRRGTGFTEEKAKVIVFERDGDDWTGLTTRADEAGKLIGELLGMNADQFSQVAMLPQGEFARFLRASGDERRGLLERLFAVRVYSQAEAWLAEERRRTGRLQQESRQRVDFAIQRIDEAAGEDLRAALAADPAAEAERTAVSATGPVETLGAEELARSEALRQAAAAAAVQAGERTVQVAGELHTARAALDQGNALAERRRRHADALALRRTLDGRAAERAGLETLLDEAARADRVLPLLAVARQRAAELAKTRALAEDAVKRARHLLREEDGPAESAVSPGRLAALEDARRAETARLSELLAEEARLAEVRRDLDENAAGLAALTAEAEANAAGLAQLPAQLAAVTEALAAARLDAARLPAAEAAEALAHDLVGVERELAVLDGDLDALARRETDAAARDAEIPARLAEVSGRLAEVRAAAVAVPEARAGASAATAVLEAVGRRERLAAETETAAAELRTLVDRAQESRERWLDVRQARLEGMAAELAHDLKDGEPCAVCGSREHPGPASPAGDAPSARDERTAESAHERALAAREAAELGVVALRSKLDDAATAAGGFDRAAAATAVENATAELTGLEAVAQLEAGLQEEVGRLETERERAGLRAREAGEALAAHRTHRTQLQAERDRLRTRIGGKAESPAETGDDHRAADGDAEETAGTRALAAAREALAGLRGSAAREPALAAETERLTQAWTTAERESKRLTAALAAGRTREEELTSDAARLTARLDAARGGDVTLTARLSRCQEEAELLHEALETTTAAATAAQEHLKAEEAAKVAAREAGFPGTAAAEEAARTPAERAAKTEQLRDLDAEHAAVTSALADPDLLAAAASPAPDLDALAETLAAAEAGHTALASARDQAENRARRLADLHEELAAQLERWRPVAARYRLAERMAALANGTSGDNRWSMSLSSFVLGERLRQVVASANERLDHMSGGRYLLQHDRRKTAGARGRAGGGLGLLVSDGWTGVDRDPATLSGGESFITSLALALGLSDVVAAESGGVELGALFVDEGFGTLDEETLDGVLDILDGLRGGGRAVGIVSHVAELRTRIPAQLKVTKTRTGSTLSVSTTN